MAKFTHFFFWGFIGSSFGAGFFAISAAHVLKAFEDFSSPETQAQYQKVIVYT